MKHLTSFLVGAAMFGSLVFGDEPIHNFSAWGGQSPAEKLAMYVGWTNGYLTGASDNATTPEQKRRLRGLFDCLGQTSYPQAVAMIDKYYKDHPELWKRFLSDMLIDALTVRNGPCEGKDPKAKGAK